MPSTASPMTRRPGVTGVHSVHSFAVNVPSLADAEAFYTAFGLDVRRTGERLDLHAFGHPHRWGTVHAAGGGKRLLHVAFGIYQEDLAAFRERIAATGLGCEPHRASDGQGLWLRDPDGVPIQLVVAERTSPVAKAPPHAPQPVPPGTGAAPARSKAAPVRPQRMSHLLRFTPDVGRSIAFYRDVLGLRLSDHSGDLIAFMHAAHGSDHHVLAFAKSDRPGLHHTSWEVGSLDEVGLGSEQMRNRGFGEGWGVGRHVIGSNYFYYVRDPWKSWAEYTWDIDYIPLDIDWRAADHPPEDSIYVWGPPMHPEFINNYEEA